MNTNSWKNYLFTGFLILMAIFALVPLFSLLWSVLFKGLIGLVIVGEQAGWGNLIMTVGTAMMTTTIVVLPAYVIAMSIGIGLGIYISIHRGSIWATVVAFISEMLSGAPSLVVGMLAYAILTASTGKGSLVDCGLALVFFLFPFAAYEMNKSFQQMPTLIVEGGLALGANRTNLFFQLGLPVTQRALFVISLLALIRAFGEAALLLFIAPPAQAILPVQIFRNAFSGNAQFQHYAWIDALLMLLVIGIIFFMAKRLGRNRLERG